MYHKSLAHSFPSPPTLVGIGNSDPSFPSSATAFPQHLDSLHTTFLLPENKRGCRRGLTKRVVKLR